MLSVPLQLPDADLVLYILQLQREPEARLLLYAGISTNRAKLHNNFRAMLHYL